MAAGTGPLKGGVKAALADFVACQMGVKAINRFSHPR
jgi:hypothetical protein